jgi:hypothetical protein
MTVINPEAALVSFREKLETMPKPVMGADKRPIHWMIRQTSKGFLFLDSARLLMGFGYSGINMEVRHKMEGRTIELEEMGPLFQKFLDWLGLNLPDSKDWAVEFKLGCPAIPCDREVLPEEQ